jgi:ribonuclease P protein component
LGEQRTSAIGHRATFQRHRRLPNKAAFDAVLRRPAVRVTVGAFWLSAGPGQARSARLGLAVAKRILRRASMRNRAKRVIREAFRQHTDLPPWDVVVGVVRGRTDVDAADASRLFRVARARFDAHDGR